MTRYLFALTAACWIGFLGCRQSPLPPDSAANLLYVPADPDFRTPAFDTQVRVQVLDTQGRSRRDVTVLLELLSTSSFLSRKVPPSGFEGDAWTFDVKRVENTDHVKLWVAHRGVGITAARLHVDLLRDSSTSLSFVLDTAEAGELRSIQFLSPDGKPVPGLRVAADAIHLPEDAIASRVPDELWEVSREVTDENGQAILRTPAGVAIAEVRAESIRYGRQNLDVADPQRTTARLARTGTVKLHLDDSVGRLEIAEIVLSSSVDNSVVGSASVLNPGPGTYEFRLRDGNLFINAWLKGRNGALVTTAQRPYRVRASEDLTIDLAAVDGCKLVGRLVSKLGDSERPIVGAQLSIYTEESIQRAHFVSTDEQGAFSACLAPGVFEIGKVVRIGKTFVNLNESVERVIDVGRQELDVGILSVPPLYALDGEAVGSDDRPVAYAEIVCMAGGERIGGGRTDAEGKFKAITQATDTEHFSVWPAGINRQFRAVIENARPLRLRVNY